MGPVNYTTFVVPLVFAIEPNDVSFSQRIDPGSKIDIMCDQDHIPAVDFYQEPLVPAAFVVVRKEFDHLSVAGNLNIAPFARNNLMKLSVFRRIDCGPGPGEPFTNGVERD